MYLPPKYLNDPDESKAYIPKLKNTKLPTPEQTQKLETQNPSRNSQGILITPPGAHLATLFEKTLGTSFTRTDLNHMIQTLPRIVIDDLEMATDLKIATEATNPAQPTENHASPVPRAPDKIHVTITESIFNEISREIEKMQNIQGNLGCPLTSAIACAIAKATGKLTIIEEEKTSQDGQTKEVKYGTYEEE